MSQETYEVTVHKNGAQFWRQNGELHRLDGPAIILLSGYNAYYIKGKLHRTDGPATIWSDGTEYYYLHGGRLTKEEFEAHPETPFEGKTATRIEYNKEYKADTGCSPVGHPEERKGRIMSIEQTYNNLINKLSRSIAAQDTRTLGGISKSHRQKAAEQINAMSNVELRDALVSAEELDQ